jgi:N-acyl-D-amino-acid deacylase
MSEHYDLLIENTHLVDGTGRPGFPGSIGVRGERIAAIGTLDATASHVIDGRGLVTCPGFIDPHSHADVTLLKYPLAESLLMQGVTTVIAGNCGTSLAPFRDAGSSDILTAIKQVLGTQGDIPWRTFAEWLGVVESAGSAVNYAPLVGHSMLRIAAMGGQTYQPATEEQITVMEQLAREAMRSGAFGLSFGLDGSWPGAYAQREELVRMARIAGDFGGFFTPHTRFHQNQWPASRPDQHGYGLYHGAPGEIFAGRYHGLLEAVEISRQAGRVPVTIAHFTPAYTVPLPQPDYLAEAVARATLETVIDRAWDEGLKVLFNVVAWQHHIGGMSPIIDSFYSFQLSLPPWLRAMKKEDFAAALLKPDFRQQVKELVYSGTFKFNMVNPVSEPYWMDNSRILECQNSEYVGRTIGEIARQREPHSIVTAAYKTTLEVLFDILAADPHAQWVHFRDLRHDRVLATFLQHPAASPCTDGFALSSAAKYEDGIFPYGICPGYFSMFPHYIQEFVKEKATLSLEEAVRKATSFPAREMLGLADRGVLAEGAYADLVVFNYENLRGNDDYRHPTCPPQGINQVIVNGKVAFEQGQSTGLRAGKVLRHT